MAALAASSLLMAESAAAVQPIPNPSPPKFTVYLVNNPYEVPATTPTVTTDPYTGEQKQLTPGRASYTVDNLTIQLWILNEQSSYSNGTTNFMPYFDVRTKGHFEEIWRELDKPFEAPIKVDLNQNGTYIDGYSPAQLDRKYTVITFSAANPATYYTYAATYPPNATIDFQVSTIIGYTAPKVNYESHSFFAYPYDGTGIALYAQSGWSEIQSITINSNNTVLASTLDNPSKPGATPIPLPTDTPKTNPKNHLNTTPNSLTATKQKY